VAIVFKDLQKLISQQQQENTRKELFQRLHDKPFWIWDKQQHKLEDIKTDGDCCFNHIIGLPTKEGIEKAKASPSFEREYNLKYLGKIGNVFHTKDIEAAIEKGRKYNPDDFSPSHFTSISMGIDPAYGSSAFGIVVTQFVDDHVEILYAEEYHRPDYNEMLSVVYGLMSKYHIDKVYIDGANPSFIKSLKLQIGEDPDYDKVIARYKSEGLGGTWSQNMRIIPVNFNSSYYYLTIKEISGNQVTF
jgi:hypothetical protein